MKMSREGRAEKAEKRREQQGEAREQKEGKKGHTQKTMEMSKDRREKGEESRRTARRSKREQSWGDGSREERREELIYLPAKQTHTCTSHTTLLELFLPLIPLHYVAEDLRLLPQFLRAASLPSKETIPRSNTIREKWERKWRERRGKRSSKQYGLHTQKTNALKFCSHWVIAIERILPLTPLLLSLSPPSSVFLLLHDPMLPRWCELPCQKHSPTHGNSLSCENAEEK